MDDLAPRVMFVDIETAPHLIYAWDTYETNAITVVKEGYILSFAYQWEGEKTVVKALPDYLSYKENKSDDKALVKDLWHRLCEADVIIAHNGDRFDLRKINARFIKHGLKPPAPYKTIDTLKIARNVAAFPSNKLDNLSKHLGIGRKLPHTGFNLWEGCMRGDEKSWRVMKKYNAHDVFLLREVYLKLRPYAKSHPDMRLYDRKDGCPRCRSDKIQRRGKRFANARVYRQYFCRNCGHWFSGEVIRHI